MTTAGNIPGILASAQTSTLAAAPASSSVDSATTKPLTQASTTSISPRIVNDPSAGIIIQYLNSSGQVQSQIPSATVVAYLRAGLTAQGYPRAQSTQA